MMNGDDDDRLLGVDDRSRGIARELYDGIRSLPIISPHGHVDATMLVADSPFPDPTALLIRPDHYVTRMLIASGADPLRLRQGSPEEVWADFVAAWPYYAGTATGYWLAHQLRTLFSIDLDDPDETAERSYTVIATQLRDPAFRPKQLLEAFGIEVLATTDDPLDDLGAHTALASDQSVGTRVVPTFRADAYLDPAHPGFGDAVVAVAARFGTAPDDLDAHLDGLAACRADFRAAGAVSADHGVLSPYTVELEPEEARRLFRLAVRGEADERAVRALAGHLLLWSAAQSARDGLVMTIHAGVLRDYSSSIHAALGRDAGYDIPVATEFTRNLRPLLERFGHTPGFHLVLFTVDETTWSRELAPLAGAYPSVYIGAPWWFLDAPDAVRRFRAATAESAGLLRGSGFIDDTRALTSIPARHDMARRLDAAYLATLVVEGRMTARMAERLAYELTVDLPRRVFKL